MKERLIILSDLWGKEKSDWLIKYTLALEQKFEIVYYDSCKLGNIDKSDYSQDSLHKQFVEGGIEKAVDKLLELEKEPINLLAFSIGGTIAWQFGLKGGHIKSLCCVSSTRLRKETQRPNGRIELFFGENDAYRPEKNWLESMRLEYEVLFERGHQVYSDQDFAQKLSQKILGYI